MAKQFCDWGVMLNPTSFRAKAYLTVAALAAAFLDLDNALATPCTGQNTGVVVCPTITTNNAAERNTAFNGNQTVTITGTVTGAGVEASDGGANHNFNIINTGSVQQTINVPSPFLINPATGVQQLGALGVQGNGGSITYNGTGSADSGTVGRYGLFLNARDFFASGNVINADAGSVTVGSAATPITGGFKSSQGSFATGAATITTNGDQNIFLGPASFTGAIGLLASTIGVGNINITTTGNTVFNSYFFDGGDAGIVTGGTAISASSRGGNVAITSNAHIGSTASAVEVGIDASSGLQTSVDQTPTGSIFATVAGISAGGDVNVRTEAGSMIFMTGGAAISAFGGGTGGVIVTVDGRISGSPDVGVAAGIGDIQSARDVMVTQNTSLTANANGVTATHKGTGNIVVSAGPAATISAGGFGVAAVASGGGIVVNTAGAVTAGRDAINTAAGFVNSLSPTGVVIMGAQTAGGATVVTVGAGGATGGLNGVNASSGTGDITVSGLGPIAGTNGIGVKAISAGGNITVASTNTISGGTTGVFAQSGGSGNVAVTTTGNIGGGSGFGIDTAVSTGVSTISVRSNSTLTGRTGALNLTSSGAGSSVVNNAGVINGSIASAGTTTMNNAGAINLPNPNGTLTGVTTFNQQAGTFDLGTNSVALGTLNLTGGTIQNGVLTGSAYNLQTGTVSAVLAGTATINKTGPGTVLLSGHNTDTGATNINAGTLQTGIADALTTATPVTIAAGAIFDLNGFSQSIGSLAGVGGVTLGTATLITGNDGTSTIFSGGIAGTGGLTKVGVGTFNLSGLNSYTGGTTVNGGVLSVNGSIASSSLTTVNSGGTLGGNGVVGNTTINGGTLSPGNSIGLLTVQGNLLFATASNYMVEVSPSNADRTNVTGTATLGGATVNASFAAGTYVAKQYTIINATGGVIGTFNGPVNTNLPGGFQSSLTYDGNNAYLSLAIYTGPNFATGLNVNQKNVATALTGFFDLTGGIPIVFGSLTPMGLTVTSGELPVGSQQATFDAMGLFLGLLTEPFVAGRGDCQISTTSSQTGPDQPNCLPAHPRDAYAAIHRKAPIIMAGPFIPRWSTWVTGYGGSQTTDGNAALGSNNTTSRVFGVAAGADYIFSPYTIAGFALAGGGTNFSVANGGTGRSDLFQAGAFIRHTVGKAYITSALAYGWQDITTDRTVTIAGVDRLRARFDANAYSGRVEGGYRFVAPWVGGIGITPYAAGEFTAFDLPGYAENAIAGLNTFALTYNAKSVTETRSELGIRSDKSFAMTNAIFTLRGRAAWAHDFNPDRSINATFQTLPGASFVVNGARQAADAALVTASAEMKWLNGWSAAATFEGEFSDVTRSYAGKGVVRYAW